VGALLAFPNWTGAQPPGPGRDFHFRSTAELDLGQLDAARADAERATRLEPLEVPAWLQLGSVCVAQGDLVCAESGFGRALELHPEQTAALTALGELRERSGDPAAAHGFYCRAIAAQPGFPPPLLAAAALELRAGLDREAEWHLETAPERARSLLRFRIVKSELERRQAGAGATRQIAIHPSEEREATALVAELDTPLAPGTIEPCPAASGPTSGR
jgi:Tfp pilus assembly protein PilF